MKRVGKVALYIITSPLILVFGIVTTAVLLKSGMVTIDELFRK